MRSLGASGRLLVALVASIVTGLLLAVVALPVVGGVGLAAKAGADEFLVLPEELVTQPPPVRSRILAADGSTITSLYKENRVRTPLADINEQTQKALIAIEDSRFYAHNGVDYKGTARAAVENLRRREVSQGGSTLTQQYVKNALLQAAGDSKQAQQAARETTFDRKLKEARYALALEQRLSKDEILERYFNIAYFGNGAYGIGAAASFYFGVAPNELRLSQSATLAGIVQSPRRFDPVKAQQDPAVMRALITRRNTVLERMREEGFITEQERIAAASEYSAPERPLFRIKRIESGCENTVIRAPFFCDYVRKALEDTNLVEGLGSTREQRQNALLSGGLTIKTTLSPGIQAIAQRSVEEAVPPADDFGAGAVANVVEPGTGRVKAMAVNRRYTESKARGNTKVNFAIGGSSGFQAGSTFKPFVLAAALKQGVPLSQTFVSPAKYTSDVFKNYTNNGIEPYTVRNAGDSEAGTFDLVNATHESVNTYFIQLLELVGIDASAELAESLGLRQFQDGRPQAPLQRVPSLVLGTNEVSPLDMAAAYAAFAAHGKYCPPVVVAEVLKPDGSAYKLNQPACKQVLEPAVADTVTSVLRGVIEGPGPRTGASAAIGRPAAGKTGTTNGSKAAWFVGYTPQLATAVWVGYPGGPGDPVVPMRGVRINGQYYGQVYGGTIPAAIWKRTMRTSLQDVPVVDFERADREVANGRSVAIPDVSGQSYDRAAQALRDAGFTVRRGGRVNAAPVRSGRAAYTSPRAGRERAFGSRVTLYESNGRRSSAPRNDPPVQPARVEAPAPEPAAPQDSGAPP